MNPSDAISLDESQIRLLFEEAGMLEEPVMNPQRVEKVMERAMHENVIADLSTFMFKSVPSVVDGVLSVSTGKVNHGDSDYKA
ncbi:hypothetical protein JIN77_05555 [Verrucomicrobiaceae bacterium R5-34]|uniref:Uncharacterized protein n=1 Tax=Oceaniferula flava TaxID=2800421 RepID=A0AAE2SDA6_9BACT|nr:hypothetical protein [Oceaniferula flavus]MBK1830178.1 hypothetical protein [Verrucomicrobiaceae bacterium R5-34]MBK1854769.1 hypothetical protein [Oceaniferula flavus]MBM1136075.1 hypothetical protein [Oceaniferula flavus]